MIKPERLQLKRERGWKMPDNAAKVDRTSKFGNPFAADRYGREQATALHRLWITGEMTDEYIKGGAFPQLIATHLVSRRQAMGKLLPSLTGKNLACWCSLNDPCHADTLLELANFPTAQDEAVRRKAG